MRKYILSIPASFFFPLLQLAALVEIANRVAAVAVAAAAAAVVHSICNPDATSEKSANGFH